MSPRPPGRGLPVLVAGLALLAAAGLPPAVLGCTSAVSSGAATADGRPILRMHRDADELANHLVSNPGGRRVVDGPLAVERRNVETAERVLAPRRASAPAPDAVRAVQAEIARCTLEETRALLPR